MIRVNLLPRRRETKREGGKAWIVLLAAAALAMIVGIVIVHAGKKKELDDQLEQNRAIEASIADKKAKVANHEAVKKQLAEYQAREDAIAKLQAGRTGPTAMMIELSRILTPRKMPTMDQEALEKLRRENPGAVPSEKWDPHRLWITSFRESDRNVGISGFGKTNDDVAEFLRRLTVSKYFEGVVLVRTEEKMEKDAVLGVMYSTTAFELKAKVRY
jgi:type IV pilus assembly protein PilN